MTSLKTILAASAALVLGASAAMALDATKNTTKPAKVHTPASIECSKQADAKNLHGQERKKFRSECKAKMMKGEAPKSTEAPKMAPKTMPAKPSTAPKS